MSFQDFRLQIADSIGGAALVSIFNKAKDVDLGRIGLRSGFRDTSISKTKREQLMKFAVACAMSQGIGGGQTEGALIIRGFLPQFDFADDCDIPFKTNEWTFDYGRYASYPHVDRTGIEPPFMKWKTIATTSKSTKNDMKVYMLYGFKYLDTNHHLHAHEIQIWRRGTKLLDRFPLPKYPTDKPRKLDIFETPWLFKKDDLMEIRVMLKSPLDSNDELTDRIQFLGFVVEPIGVSTMG